MTDEFCDDEWACKVRGKKVYLWKQWHYRLVMGTVGYGLRRFRGTEELLRSTYDVFHGEYSSVSRGSASLTARTALRDAVGLASALHRDISIGNIILVREDGQATRTGYLIDWDACFPVSETGECIEAGRVVSYCRRAMVVPWC